VLFVTQSNGKHSGPLQGRRSSWIGGAGSDVKSV
jgi:hypothetical protein